MSLIICYGHKSYLLLFTKILGKFSTFIVVYVDNFIVCSTDFYAIQKTKNTSLQRISWSTYIALRLPVHNQTSCVNAYIYIYICWTFLKMQDTLVLNHLSPPPPARREQHLYLTLKAKFAELHLNKKKLHK